MCKSFADKQVLRAADCCIESGKITAVIGPNGSGKTTLLRTLALLDYPDSGEIIIDGLLYRFPMPRRARITPPWPRVTVVFQQFFLWPHLTLRENILIPARFHRIAEPNRKFQELVEMLNMAEFIDRFPNQTSGGQRQRAAMARALILEPSYILLDEITSALDVESVAAVLDQVLRLRNGGVGILLITHMLGFAQQAADHILFMEDGCVVESGGREVLEKPKTLRAQRFVALMKGAQ